MVVVIVAVTGAMTSIVPQYMLRKAQYPSSKYR